MIPLDFEINAFPTPREKNRHGILAHVSAEDRNKIINSPTNASDFKHIKAYIEDKVREMRENKE